jgi:hypothetical protein
MTTHRLISGSLRLSAAVGALLLGCGGAPSQPAPSPTSPPDTTAAHSFSSARAWSDLEELSALGPRVSGSSGAEAARRYITRQLEAASLPVMEIEARRELEGVGSVEWTHVATTIEGTSPELFVLVAPYDTGHFEEFAFLGVNDGASGAALLLELARVLAVRELPYTTRLVFVDGEGRFGRGGSDLEELRWLGSQTLAESMEEEGLLQRIRLLLALNRVCDAEIRIARDLGSHRHHREEFWKAAAALGQVEAFPAEQGFESVQASHRAFAERGVRPVVAIVDTAFGGDAPPGVYADSEEDAIMHCAPESLEVVGTVTLRALETIGWRLAKIDRFSQSPLAELEASPETSEPTPDDSEAPAAP